MAEMEQEHQNGEINLTEPIFFEKKSFYGELQQQLEKLINDFEDEKEKVKDLWQATVQVVKERHETNLSLNKSQFLKQNLKSEASTSGARRKKEDNASSIEFGAKGIIRKKEDNASSVEFGPEGARRKKEDNASSIEFGAKGIIRKKEDNASSVEFGPDGARRKEDNASSVEFGPDGARRRKEDNASSVEFSPEISDQSLDFYKTWIGEFKKNASIQRRAIRSSVLKWFNFMHQFDDVEPLPIQPISEDLSSKYLYNMSVIVLFVVSLLFIFGYDNKFMECNDGLLVCLREIIITFAFKMRNYYFKFHDITYDYPNASNISHLSTVAGSVSDS